VTLTRKIRLLGRDLPVNRGLWNFDEIRLDFYREPMAVRSLKRGLYDFASRPNRCAGTTDRFPAARHGEVIRDTSRPDAAAVGIPGVQHIDVRCFSTSACAAALTSVRFRMDQRELLLLGSMDAQQGSSQAPNCRLTPAPPMTAKRRSMLKRYASQMCRHSRCSYRLPVSDGSGRDRATLRSALTLLSQAGYDLDGTVLRQRTTKARLTFEILVTTQIQERDRAGIYARSEARRH